MQCATINMSTITNKHTADPSWRYCPPSIAPRKSGRQKKTKRFKSPLELTKHKKAKVSVQQQMGKKSKKAANMKRRENQGKKRKKSD